MDELKEAAEEGVQATVQGFTEDAAEFPWFVAIMAFLVIGGIMWSLVEVIKVTAVSKLKRKPHKDASESTVIGLITKKFGWYPIVIWSVSILGGAALGFFVGTMSDLLWWRGALIGALAGVLNSLAMKVLKGIGDKASDFFLGWIKKKLSNGGKNEADD